MAAGSTDPAAKAAKECSPRRKPWEDDGYWIKPDRGERKESLENHHGEKGTEDQTEDENVHPRESKKHEIPVPHQTRRHQARSRHCRTATHSLAYHPTRRSQPTVAAPIRSWPGNHGGARALKERVHRP